jgi:hypothetical protein
MLGAVGRPAAVNPLPELRRIALLRHWPILEWSSKENIADSTLFDAPFFGGIPSENVQ